jgi:hypothetical protein
MTEAAGGGRSEMERRLIEKSLKNPSFRQLLLADPRWRGVATYGLASGIAIVALFVMTFALVVPPDAPLHSWGGLVQRVTLAVWFPRTVVLALRLLRVARAGEEP